MSADNATACACTGSASCAACGTARVPAAVADPAAFGHAAIRERMLERIAATRIEGVRPLAGLGTRAFDDPAIALIDALAGSCHILAWNAARLADDNTLGKSEDRAALAAIVGLLGYEPRPAISAATTLTFELDNFVGSVKAARIPKGTKIASIPGQNQLPQIFETDAELEAKAEWNALLPVRAKEIPTIGTSIQSIEIEGSATGIRVGDYLLVYQSIGGADAWYRAVTRAIEPVKTMPDPLETLGKPPSLDQDLTDPTATAARTRLTVDIDRQFVTVFALGSTGTIGDIVVLGQRAAAFGATAPDMRLMPDTIKGNATLANAAKTEWAGLEIAAPGDATNHQLDLDAVYPEAGTKKYILFVCSEPRTGMSDAARVQLGRITASQDRSRTGFGLSAKITRITVPEVNLDKDPSGGGVTAQSLRYSVRETTMYVENGRARRYFAGANTLLPAVATPQLLEVKGDAALPAGRRVVLKGLDGGGAEQVEVATIKRVTGHAATAGSAATTTLEFTAPLTLRFQAKTLTLNANAVAASHGESSANGPEIIGSGNASAALPRFALKRAPLAHVAADTPRGYAPAIDVKVGDRHYTAVETLFGRGPGEFVFSAKPGADGAGIVQFPGRLPTGSFNVSADYRAGGGVAGNLGPGTIVTAMAPIVGIGKVLNPVPAEGGSDPESIDTIRDAAPQTIRTLDRVVSLADYEAFARTYRGVGKALATELPVAMRSTVCLTIATTTLLPPVAGSDIVTRLRNALKDAAAPGRTVRIEGFVDLVAQLTVALAVDPAFDRRQVESTVRTALGDAFARSARDFGQGLHRSAVLALVQRQRGVLAAKLTQFAVAGDPTPFDDVLPCPAPTLVNGVFAPAGLLSIDPALVQFAEMAP